VRSDLALLIQICVHRVAAALAGIDGLETLDAARRFMAQMRVITAGKTVDWSLEDKDRVVAAAHAAYDDFRREFFEPSLARRKQVVADARAQGSDPAHAAADMLTLMAAHREDTWKSDDGLMMREINSFITGSTQSTANAFVSFTLRLERWFEQHPADRRLVDTDPEFLSRAAFESLRMGASPPARVRVAAEDVTLASGRRITAGQRVAMFLAEANTAAGAATNGGMGAGQTAVHAAERFGEHPDAFNPRRTVAPGMAPWGITFGAGAHACPGRPLVTGSRNPMGKIGVDGTLVSLARRFHAAGMQLDPDSTPVRDPATYYEIYLSVPVLFTRL
jgi:cytochrome P450